MWRLLFNLILGAYFLPVISRRPKDNWYFLFSSSLTIVENLVLVLSSWVWKQNYEISKFSVMSKTYFLCSESIINMSLLFPKTFIFVILYTLLLFLYLLYLLKWIDLYCKSKKLFYIKIYKFHMKVHLGTVSNSWKQSQFQRKILVTQRELMRIKIPFQNCFSRYHICSYAVKSEFMHYCEQVYSVAHISQIQNVTKKWGYLLLSHLSV